MPNPYPEIKSAQKLLKQIHLYGQLKVEYGARGVPHLISRFEKNFHKLLKVIQKLPNDPRLEKKEPNDLKAIRALRPSGSRRMWNRLPQDEYREKLEGALLGRMAGCTLGAVVELWEPDRIKALALENGEKFPPVDYWLTVPHLKTKRYGTSRREEYLRHKLDGVPVDDDIIYTLLGLLVVEHHGLDFSTSDVGRVWKKYLSRACTAEKAALENLRRGIPARHAAERNNPYCEWIGADIRADPWGYMAPGWPERAAEMAYRDAYLSHRRQGVYGEMFFAAAISAAFAVRDPMDAIRVGLEEIPRECVLANAIRWALKSAPKIRNYRQAFDAVEMKFPGMNRVHTINNACLTIFGIHMGGKDFSKVIGETVAMGYDNDCNAATAGSIVGAVIGKKGIPRHWYKNFNNTIHSYLIGKRKFAITDVLKRFARQAKKAHG